jgi:hypothetical protein
MEIESKAHMKELTLDRVAWGSLVNLVMEELGEFLFKS